MALRTNHDFEDIVYVLDNRTTIVEEIISTPVHPLVLDERLPLIIEKIEQIIAL